MQVMNNGCDGQLMSVENRGGVRTAGPGKKIGRPPGNNPGLNKKPYGTRLPIWLIRWLRSQPNAAESIETAVTTHYKLTKLAE